MSSWNPFGTSPVEEEKKESTSMFFKKSADNEAGDKQSFIQKMGMKGSSEPEPQQ